eukprot:gene23364-biopygen11829
MLNLRADKARGCLVRRFRQPDAKNCINSIPRQSLESWTNLRSHPPPPRARAARRVGADAPERGGGAMMWCGLFVLPRRGPWEKRPRPRPVRVRFFDSYRAARVRSASGPRPLPFPPAPARWEQVVATWRRSVPPYMFPGIFPRQLTVAGERHGAAPR